MIIKMLAGLGLGLIAKITGKEIITTIIDPKDASDFFLKQLSKLSSAYWKSEWFSHNGQLDEDVALALSFSFKDAVDAMRDEWKQSSYYKGLDGRVQRKTNNVFRGMVKQVDHHFQSPEQLLRAAGGMGHVISIPAYASGDLGTDKSFDQIIWENFNFRDYNLASFIQARLGYYWARSFQGYLKTPKGNEAWRASQMMWQAQIRYAIENLDQNQFGVQINALQDMIEMGFGFENLLDRYITNLRQDLIVRLDRIQIVGEENRSLLLSSHQVLTRIEAKIDGIDLRLSEVEGRQNPSRSRQQADHSLSNNRGGDKKGQGSRSTQKERRSASRKQRTGGSKKRVNTSSVSHDQDLSTSTKASSIPFGQDTSPVASISGVSSERTPWDRYKDQFPKFTRRGDTLTHIEYPQLHFTILNEFWNAHENPNGMVGKWYLGYPSEGTSSDSCWSCYKRIPKGEFIFAVYVNPEKKKTGFPFGGTEIIDNRTTPSFFCSACSSKLKKLPLRTRGREYMVYYKHDRKKK